MVFELGNVSGAGNQFQEQVPVNNDQITKEAGKLPESTKEVDKSSTSSTAQPASSQVETPDRSSRTRMRYLRTDTRDTYRNVRSQSRSNNNRHEVRIPKPRDSGNSYQSRRMADVIKDAQRRYVLPKSNDLVNRLKPSTQQEVQQFTRQALTDPDLFNPTKFFDLLSKLLPLGLSTVMGGNGQTSAHLPSDLSTMLAQMMKDLAPHISKLLALENLPSDMKGVLQQLSSQLSAFMKGELSIKEQLQQSGQNQLSSQNGNVLHTMEQLMAQLQAGPKVNGNQMLITNLAMFEMMSKAISLSGKEQVKFMQDLMANKLLFSTGMINNGMLGPKTTELAKKMAEMVLLLAGKISESIQNPLLSKSSSESLFRLFSSILFGGALLGRMIADRGDGKPFGFDEAYAGQLQLQSANELKIYDLVPFSLFAAFPPLKNEDKEQNEKQKAALKMLMQLIRLLMKLAFMVTSIYTGGQKMGEGGIDYLLKKNGPMLQNTIKEIIIILKKVCKFYGIETKSPVSFLRRSRQALIEKDHAVFWSCIFAFFTDENELNTFLEEVEELDPVYQSIYDLINQGL